MSAKIIDGKAIAEKIKEEIRKKISSLSFKPTLAAVQVGENPASRVYIRSQQKNAEDLGINYRLETLAAESTQRDVEDLIERLNNDSGINGIILQMPLPEGMSAEELQQKISPDKDVEGIHPANLGKLVLGKPELAPCTAMAVWTILNSLDEPIKGKEAVMVGHSAIVGKPVTLLLLSSLNESATPTVCHIATKDLAFHTKRADILIVAVGKAGFIKGDMIKEGAIVVDVGINRMPVLDETGNPVLNEKGKPRKKTVGDVAFDEAAEKASAITPVPGGVGPLTAVMLMKNLVKACRK